MATKTKKRFTVISVPGRDDNDEASWFVLDTAAPATDVTRSRKCENMRHARREASRLNAENESRYWRNILKLRGTAAGMKRYKVFPAGVEEAADNDIGLVVQLGKDEWEVFGPCGDPLHTKMQKYASMNEALEALVVECLMMVLRAPE